ncbi:hypothetical protein [Rhizobium sp. OAE497]|uniref:hypothetical protein n=1 Tax=Rhizobium sp. OAE497 TaxID=2663796 RepID=UPI0018F61B67
MRDVMPANPLPHRPRRGATPRVMRERRTAQVLTVFGIILACVELYVILGWM